MTTRKLISFDWALKKLLRSKANYEVLEGFLSELLKDDIEILEILESEGNREQARDKLNRVDLKVKNKKGEVILIEVQYEREFDFFQRILFGASKSIVEHMAASNPYENVVKLISVSILYFDLGQGKDYVYHGTTRFVGIHHHDELQLSDKQQQYFGKQSPFQIYPEYYLLKVNQFDNVARDTLDEWIYFLKNEEIKGEFQARGLEKAREVLDVMKLTEEERLAYERHIEDTRYRISMDRSRFLYGRFEGLAEGLVKGRAEGRAEGLNEGLAEGKAEGMLQVARMMKKNGEPLEKIVAYTQLTPEEIADL